MEAGAGAGRGARSSSSSGVVMTARASRGGTRGPCPCPLALPMTITGPPPRYRPQYPMAPATCRYPRDLSPQQRHPIPSRLTAASQQDPRSHGDRRPLLTLTMTVTLPPCPPRLAPPPLLLLRLSPHPARGRRSGKERARALVLRRDGNAALVPSFRRRRWASPC